jgi:hypothetical protein
MQRASHVMARVYAALFIRAARCLYFFITGPIHFFSLFIYLKAILLFFGLFLMYEHSIKQTENKINLLSLSLSFLTLAFYFL